LEGGSIVKITEWCST